MRSWQFCIPRLETTIFVENSPVFPQNPVGSRVFGCGYVDNTVKNPQKTQFLIHR
jgi:hypothetical protein